MKSLFSFCKEKTPQVLTGVELDNLAPLCFRVLESDKLPTLFLVPTVAVAERLSSELLLWEQTHGTVREITWIPEPSDVRRINPETEVMRTRIAHNLLHDVPAVLIATPTSFWSPVLPEGTPEKQEFVIRVGDTLSPEKLLEKLVALDYDDEEEVNIPGEFSRRGGIIDIFAPAFEQPVRVEFFGNTIDSMRYFSVLTQRGTESVQQYAITPKPVRSQTEGRNYEDCLGEKKCRVVVIHPDRCDHYFSRFGQLEMYARCQEFMSLDSPRNPIQFWEGVADDARGNIAPSSDVISFMGMTGVSQDQLTEAVSVLRERIVKTLKSYMEDGYAVILGIKDLRHKDAVLQWIHEYALDANRIQVVASVIPTGYIFETSRVVYLSEYEIFYTPHQRKVIPLGHASKIDRNLLSATVNEPYVELNEGDYAVHILHGIARFHGMRILAIEGKVLETLDLEFAEEQHLYVPIHQIHYVSRYAGTGKGVPTLYRLNGRRWESMKVEAMAAIKKLAADLLRLQAVRSSVEKMPYPAESHEEYRFAAMFPYRETPDQMRAIIDVENDMTSSHPMDRLICGDVGYGKTEVAIRAIFKAVQSGKQVAVLAPTTILAQQHFFTLSERFAEYPFTLDVMSRFRTNAEHHAIIQKLKSGGLDIVIGTHRLIQDDVGFKSLGLIVIDEEQRFGVEHKERLKRMRLSADILTLSATPIPRTLYMSMTGLRDLSTLSTAPENRLSVETFVIRRNMEVLKDAMEKELARNGQIFYLHNRVKTIQKVCDNWRNALPDAVIEIAHGQMEEGELERVMSRFVEGKIDILVCTTIIESGVDIPNANTLIVDDAHRFGLSELYQLRGRVGRSNRQAYAYFLLPGLEALTSDARKRMAAIQKYTQLGTGFKLAMRDLEIRGSGNLLGAEQSGHITHLGFDLYCRMLRQTVAQLKGEALPVYPDAELILDFLDFAYKTRPAKLAAAFPPDYIFSLSQRIAAYRRLAQISDESAIEAYEDELRDRYGNPPEAVLHLLTATRIKLLASQCGFTAVRQYGGCLMLERGPSRYYRDSKGALPLLKGKTPVDQLNMIIRLLRTIRAERQAGS